jgi:hypothetical protein
MYYFREGVGSGGLSGSSPGSCSFLAKNGSFMMPVRRTFDRQMQSPLQLLQRRYAAGEITNEEYEERWAKLPRDGNLK